MSKINIFITGSTGCVGSYVFDELIKNSSYKLHLLAKTPGKLRINEAQKENVVPIHSSLYSISEFKDLLQEMDYVIHIATVWGGRACWDINFEKTMEFFSLLNPQRCRKIINFSTASILTDNNELISQSVVEQATGYIETKYKLYQQMKSLPIASKITTLFPTLVMGGGYGHSISHINSGLKTAAKYIKLLRYFTADSQFHHIHGQDIALVINYLLENDNHDNNLVLGNDIISADYIIETLSKVKGVNRSFKLDITDGITKYFPQLLNMSPWQKYSLEKRHFVYNTVNTKTFGIDSPYQDFEYCVRDCLGLI
ncbi:MAG TPA: hypothetical protein DF296_04135 [Candidatus Margulisbacteria bacterium]|nr:MAG: hypothetical protein A2X42_09110 [Candidatus Margulisbacteria bacterium GWF2_38_17]OGI07852.1 MAG: hypothetical protein A2X41_12045 [Candidatus Margulisbacteria bacterium GWE2_39_32]HCT84371.1 hypothetical protein [Candidatus Margulisiibacteriota bacterium]